MHLVLVLKTIFMAYRLYFLHDITVALLSLLMRTRSLMTNVHVKRQQKKTSRIKT